MKNSRNKNVVLSRFKGKVVLLDFWATWCKPCWKAIPHLMELQKKYKDKGFTIIGILMDRNAAGYVPQIEKKSKLNYPLLVGTSEVQQAYNIRGFPTLVLIDKKGVVRKLWIGGKKEEAIEKEIKKLIAEQ